MLLERFGLGIGAIHPLFRALENPYGRLWRKALPEAMITLVSKTLRILTIHYKSL